MLSKPFENVRKYHEEHGDDYGSEESRRQKYETIFSLVPRWTEKSILDVGAGEGEFGKLLNTKLIHLQWKYYSLDLLSNTNVLDYHEHHDIVVANGIFYKLDNFDQCAELIRHMWWLTKECLVFTSLSTWAPTKHPFELYLNPSHVLEFCRELSLRVTLRHDYLPHDFTVALYR